MVDLFSGIGYFSLPYLVHAGAAFLHACEWNPAAVRAIHINMERNKIPASKYQVHVGDNRQVCPRGVADRVNLGLIPSAEISYKTACLALKPGVDGMMHIHGNVDRRRRRWRQDRHDQQEDGDDPSKNSENLFAIQTAPGYGCKYPEWNDWACLLYTSDAADE